MGTLPTPDVWRSWPDGMLQALLASVVDAVYVVDPDGRVLFANPAAVLTLGYDDAGELLGRLSHPTIHYKRPDGTPFPDEECPLLRPRATGEAVQVEQDWFVRRDGSMVPVAYSSSPLQMAEGRGAVVVFRDISERLEAEEARLREGIARSLAEELEASRARIVAAADAERRRIGRDLHDGAQQRLVHLLMLLQGATARVGEDDEAVRDALGEAAGHAREAVQELRELVAGIHPAILTNRGLGAAVEALTARSPLPVAIDVPDRRWPAPVEVSAYFVVAEALTNAAKHAAQAGASRAWVRASDCDGRLLVEVGDDGPGGAAVGAGSGLTGLADRVAVLGGTLEVVSPVGGGTVVRAGLPVEGGA
ncbi:histidine kinase [Conexibacter sp. SYSU D00693]|uniref:sensor histidine kinase n=1 Tax=Conexibacter sp. SYSU D00693 TaxID=2812560 RepID=UPI001F11BEDD|nr:histidine kinase [Conexibacter sp. SYSU D00693]